MFLDPFDFFHEMANWSPSSMREYIDNPAANAANVLYYLLIERFLIIYIQIVHNIHKVETI